MGHTDYSMGVDSWKLCCGPFCSDCHVAMERQGERVAQLEAAVKALGDCIKATCKKHKMEVATLAILNNPIAAAAVREAGR